MIKQNESINQIIRNVILQNKGQGKRATNAALQIQILLTNSLRKINIKTQRRQKLKLKTQPDQVKAND